MIRSLLLKRTLPLFAATLAFTGVLWAEEKNGIDITVAKTTLDRNDSRLGYSLERVDRTQGLKVTIKNVTFKDMPEGEIEWQILVRKYLSNVIYSYSGTQKIDPLKVAGTQEVKIGSAEIQGWREGGSAEKDKLEWQVVVKQNGVQRAKLQSTSNYDLLAKRAMRGPVAPGGAPAAGAPVAPVVGN